jgi:hypothetical protein
VDQLLSAGILLVFVNRSWGKFRIISLKMQPKFSLGIDTNHINLLYVKYFGGGVIFYMSSGAVAASLTL